MTDLRTRLQHASGVFPPTNVDFDDLTRRRYRKRRGKRVLSGFVALVVASGGTVTAFMTLGPSGRLLPTGPTAQYVHPTLGWSMEYPSEWRLQNFENQAASYGEVGVFVSNLDHEFRHPDWGGGFTNQWDLRGLSPELVAIAVSAEWAGPCCPTDVGSYTAPLLLAEFEPAEATDLEPFPQWQKQVDSSGTPFYVRVWIGTLASEADRDAAREIVGSIRFGPEPTTEPSPVVSGEPDSACGYPRFGPYTVTGDYEDQTGSPVPPDRQTSGDGDAIQYWDRPDGAYLALARHDDIQGAAVEPTGSLTVMRHAAWLGWSDEPGGSELWLSWAEAERRCQGYSLRLYDPSLSQVDARTELLEIGSSVAYPPDDQGRYANLTFSPAAARVGERVEFTGTGFEEDIWDGAIPQGEYGISLIGGPHCGEIATTEHHIEFGPGGTASGWLIVPETGFCFQSDEPPVPVEPGPWRVIASCHTCEVGEFEVLP